MDKRAVFGANAPADLTDGLKERLAFNVAHRAADLHDEHIRVGTRGRAHHARLDLIRDVGDDLHRAAVVAARALPLDHRLVDLAGGGVVVPGELFIDKALVMADVKVRLRAVVRHIHLAVLIGVHRAGVNVEIRIELADGHAVPPALEQAAKRRRGDALAEG